MLFLFVLMLVGVDCLRLAGRDASRASAWPRSLAGLGLRRPAARRRRPTRSTCDARSASTRRTRDGNVHGRRAPDLQPVRFAFEVTGALLITAALGAMVLAHRERTGPRPTQRELAERASREGAQAPPLPAPGRLRRHNAVDIPGAAARRHAARAVRVLTAARASPDPPTSGAHAALADLDQPEPCAGRRAAASPRRAGRAGRAGAEARRTPSEPGQLPRTCRRCCSPSAPPAC